MVVFRDPLVPIPANRMQSMEAAVHGWKGFSKLPKLERRSFDFM